MEVHLNFQDTSEVKLLDFISCKYSILNFLEQLCIIFLKSDLFTETEMGTFE